MAKHSNNCYKRLSCQNKLATYKGEGRREYNLSFVSILPFMLNVEGVDVRLNDWARPIRRGLLGVAYTGVSRFHFNHPGHGRG